jgi:hypothetical protein
LAAIVMLLGQIGLGLWVAQAVSVPAADSGADVFLAVGRALGNGPAALTVHVTLGILLLITAISAIIRAVLARQKAVLVISVAGLAAITLANVDGARFVGSGQNADSSAMMVAAVVALVCYGLSLVLLRQRRAVVSRSSRRSRAQRAGSAR